MTGRIETTNYKKYLHDNINSAYLLVSIRLRHSPQATQPALLLVLIKGKHMPQQSFQDYYPDYFAHCFGCGKLNEDGHQIKSYWDGDESVCHFMPKPYHIAIPGYVYGGLLASLIDCHGTGTAAAAMYKSLKEQDPNAEPNTRFLTASLHVDYLKPTPLGVELEVRGKVKQHSGRKVVIEEWILANGIITVRGEVVAVQVPESMVEELLKGK